MYVVRYWLAGRHPSRIPWRGPSEADNWFALRETWGEERQSEKLRNMIDVSDRPDYWEALNLIAARLHDKRQRFPDELADWASQVHRGKIPRPKKRQSNKGQPPYANDVRNFSYADAFDLLGFLGLIARWRATPRSRMSLGWTSARFRTRSRRTGNQMAGSRRLGSAGHSRLEGYPEYHL